MFSPAFTGEVDWTLGWVEVRGICWHLVGFKIGCIVCIYIYIVYKVLNHLVTGTQPEPHHCLGLTFTLQLIQIRQSALAKTFVLFLMHYDQVVSKPPGNLKKFFTTCFEFCNGDLVSHFTLLHTVVLRHPTRWQHLPAQPITYDSRSTFWEGLQYNSMTITKMHTICKCHAQWLVQIRESNQ